MHEQSVVILSVLLYVVGTELTPQAEEFTVITDFHGIIYYLQSRWYEKLTVLLKS
jgi:hypothetical protein